MRFVENLSFPILVLKDDWMGVYESESLYSVCFRAFVGDYPGAEIIDSGGARWRVDEVEILRVVGPWWKRVIRSSSQLVEVDPKASWVSDVDVGFVKGEVLNLFSARKRWGVMTESLISEFGYTEAKEVEAGLKDCISLDEIFTLLLNVPGRSIPISVSGR